MSFPKDFVRGAATAAFQIFVFPSVKGMTAGRRRYPSHPGTQ